MSEIKYQYFCTKCGTERDSLLDHPAIGIGGYSWNCPRCDGPVDSREVVMNEAPEKLSVLQRGCTRSHPHENMDYECELKTVIVKMMNENKRRGPPNSPKKIWVRELPRKEDGILIGLSYHTEPEGLVGETEIPYIREDVVFELVEALKDLTNRTSEICEWSYGDEMDEAFDKARAALAKLEESHE